MIGKKFTELTRTFNPSTLDQLFLHTTSGAKRATVGDLLSEQESIHISESTLSNCTFNGGTSIQDGLEVETISVDEGASVGGALAVTGSVSTSGDISAPSGSVTSGLINVGSENISSPEGLQFWNGGSKKGHIIATPYGIEYLKDGGIGSIGIHAPIELYDENVYVDFHANNSTGDFTTRICNYGTEPDTLVFQKPANSGLGLARCVGNFQTSSSRQLKENIESISEETALNSIMKMDPVSFDYKWDEHASGFIAEDMAKIIPEAVHVPKNYDEETFEYKGAESAAEVPSIDYSQIIPYLVKVVQSQQKRIEELEASTK